MRRADTLLRKIVRACALCILTCTLCTCVSPLPQENSAGGARTVTVYFGGDGRAAIPVLPKDVCYKITAESESGKDIEPVTITDGSNLCDLELSGSTGDTWTITVNAYVENPEAPLLTGSATLTVPEKSVTVPLSYISSENAKGNVSLEITVDSATGVNKLYISGTNTDLDGEYTVEGSTITIEKDGIDAGTYDALFSFYSDDVLIARCRETINVYGTLTTSRWVTAGNSILINSTGTFNLTSEAVAALTSTTLYVKGSTGSTLTATAADSDSSGKTNSGTWLEPFATLQAAVNRVIALNNAQSADGVAYTVFIDGKISYTTPDTSNPVDMAVIDPGDSGRKLNLTICGMNSADTLTVTASRILYIGAKASVTVKNLKLTGGNGASAYGYGYGGGVYVDGGTFTLDSGGVITGCKAISGSGGGVYMTGSASNLIMNSGTISNNTANSLGGGVGMAAGTFEMNSGEISGNTATSDGGGVGMNRADSSEQNPTVSFEMNGGTISGNTASANGGGMYMSGGNATMTGGTISDNTANSLGGGVYMPAWTFEMSGGSISGNTAANGGGVYVENNTETESKITTKFTMSIGKNNTVPQISGNTASASGGGVYINAADNFEMNGGSISGNKTTNGSGGGVYTEAGLTLSSKDAVITGNTATANGGGVYVAAGTFEMSAGTISGNTATFGGGVWLCSGEQEHTLSAGAISGNTAGNGSTGKGGGVYVAGGTFILRSAGEISGNTVIMNSERADGGGVYLDNGIFTMDGGSIVGNTVGNTAGTTQYPHGGGVYINGGTFTMKDGTISGNAATGRIWSTDGGGVYVGSNDGVIAGKFEMTGGTIGGTEPYDAATEDKTDMGNDSVGNAGGVHMDKGTFTMSGGKIIGNTAGCNGGGIFIGDKGMVKISNGSIINNAAYTEGTRGGDGGGVYVNNGTFEMFGTPVITGNIISLPEESTRNVYLCLNDTITVTGAFAEDASVGIMAASAPCTFTTNFGTNASGNAPASVFFSDVSTYKITTDGDGEACLTAN